MHKVITDLYYGNLQPAARTIPSDSEYARLATLSDEQYNELRSQLPQQHHALLNELCSTLCDMSAKSSEMMFCDGFCLGMQLAKECFADDRAMS